MNQLVFATNNQKKVDEIKAKLPDLDFITLKELGVTEDIPETSNTIEGNASQKSNYLFKNYTSNCFADDTGLEIEALNGEPGVYSARYAGDTRDANKNMDLVLEKLKHETNRKARFKTVVSLIIDGKETLFTGIVNGKITKSKQGKNGFGYDPIFVPNGYDQTFAELSLTIKNKISHRALAVDKLIDFLSN